MIAKVRANVSGKNLEACYTQQSSELKMLPKDSKISICSRAGVKQKSFLSNKVSLAIKTVTGMSWNQHRVHKRFLSSAGMTCSSEAKERQERTQLLADHLRVKTIYAKEKNDKDAGSVKGFCNVKAPLVYVNDLILFVKERLDNIIAKCLVRYFL